MSKQFIKKDFQARLSREIENLKQRVLGFAGSNTLTSYQMEDWFLPIIDKLQDLERQVDGNFLELEENSDE